VALLRTDACAAAELDVGLGDGLGEDDVGLGEGLGEELVDGLGDDDPDLVSEKESV